MRVYFVHPVKAGRCRSGDEQIALWPECKVIGGNAGLERCKNKNLAAASDLKNRATAGTHIKVLLAIESDTSGNAHALSVRRHSAVGCNAIHRTVVPCVNIHLDLTGEGDSGRIHHLRK